jgi:hypothetical protein
MAYNSWASNIYNTIAREADLRRTVGNMNRARTPDQQDITFYEYKSPQFGFTIQCPSNWEKIESQNGVNFLSPLDNATDRYREGVSIQVFDHRGYSLEQYAGTIINDFSQKTQLYVTYSNPSDLSGYPAIEFHCMFYLQSIPCEIKSLFSLINDKLYLLEYHASDYARFLPIADKMISTFKGEASRNLYSNNNSDPTLPSWYHERYGSTTDTAGGPTLPKGYHNK